MSRWIERNRTVFAAHQHLASHGWACPCPASRTARDVVLAFDDPVPPALPQRSRLGLAADAVLPAAVDVSRLQALLRDLAPGGWSTDDVAMQRALAGLLASMRTTAEAEGGQEQADQSQR